MNSWTYQPLEKLTSLIKDGSHGTHQDVSEGVPFLSAKDVRDGYLRIPSDCRRISELDYASIHKNYEISAGDVLLTIVGTIGRCCLIKGSEPRFSIQRSVAVIRAANVVPEYLFQYFQSAEFQTNLTDVTNASAQGGVYLGSLSKCPVKLPVSKPEQAKIAEILSTVDRAIKQTEAAIAKQQHIKTGLMQDLLTRGIDEEGNLRSEDTHKFKDSVLGRIPEEWDPSNLGVMAKFNSGYAFKNEELTEDGWRVVRISNLHKPDFPYWHYSGPIKETWKIKAGDILFSWAGVAKSIDCICYNGPDALMNQHIYNLIFETDLVKRFVYYFLQQYLPVLRTEIEGGAGQLHLTKAKIQGIGIPEIIGTELKRIVTVLEQNEELISGNMNRLAKLHRLKTGLMQDLLTGNRRVTAMLTNITGESNDH